MVRRIPIFLLLLVQWCALVNFIIARDQARGATLAGSRSADFYEAVRLEHAGETNEAFIRFLTAPGGEFAAGTLAMRSPSDFLKVLTNSPEIMSCSRAQLIQADLLASLGRQQEARVIYQWIATNLAAVGRVEEGGAYYFVEPVLDKDDYRTWGLARVRAVAPFTYGPGSHRDNWLLRRLITMGLAEEAANEFARLWSVHCGRSNDATNAFPGEDWVRSHPCGFSNLELQFLLDYSYFLNRGGKTNQSRALCLGALEIMDPDCRPKLPPVSAPTAPAMTGSNSIAGGIVALQPVAVGAGMFQRATGTSQEDFCRLVYGVYKAAGREADLIATLQGKIESGANHTRRVLAIIRRHRGENDAALALELEYIAKGNFDLLTTACRRGVAFEDYQQMTNAIAEFEAALNLSSALPEKERSMLETYSVRDRLARFYTAQGRMEEVLELDLAQFATHPAWTDDFGRIEQLKQRFAVAGQTNRFAEWARATLAASSRPTARANLAWQLADFKTASLEAAKAGSRRTSFGFSAWLERFERLGPEHQQAFLTKVVELFPDDLQSQLDLLDLMGELQSPSAAACYERMLQHADFGFWRSFYPHRFRYPKNPVEAAARLARVYERAERFDDLRALGLKLARCEPPFVEFEQNLYFYVGDNGRNEFVHAILGLAVQYADDRKYQAELAAALKKSPWNAALAQLERRMAHEAGTSKPAPVLPAVKWANVPEGVELFVSCENVCSLASAGKFVYAGQPWGIAVYDFNGNLVECVALGQPVTAMVMAVDAIWAATPAGLFRLRRSSDGWDIVLQPASQTIWPDRSTTTHGISALSLRGDELWMADELGCRLLNVRSLEISRYSPEEMKLLPTNPFAATTNGSNRIVLSNGTEVFGRGSAVDCWKYWPLIANRDETEGGLFFVSGAGAMNRVSAAPHANLLGGDGVFKVFLQGDDYWLCTSLGVARMNKHLQVIERLSRRDGLLGNLVTSGTSLGEKVFFGCAWDWHGGGLLEFDSATGVFTSYTMADGMDANRVEDVDEGFGGNLKIIYAGETRMNESPDYRLSPPGLFDLKMRQFKSGGPFQPVSQTEGWKMNFEWDRPTPVLGGPLNRKIVLDGRTFYCGMRGMAVVRGGKLTNEFARLGVREIPSLDERLRAEADAFDPRGWTSPEGVLRGLEHTNQYIRARIICALYKQPAEVLNGCIPALDKALDDPFDRVRDNAVQLIIKTQANQALSALRHALKNSKLEIRVLAACELAKRGEVPPLNILEDWLKKGDQNVSISQGYDIYNILQDCAPADTALARIGNTDAAALSLRYACHQPHLTRREVAVAAWGESVRKNPETADVWLTARGRDPKSRLPMPPYAREVFQRAGKGLSPKLHQALTSTNRVIRSNAARACGAIGDPSSVPHLLAALDLESGLSRASIVWALGELKATNAVPQLCSLYTETCTSPLRPASRAGFLWSQTGDSYSAQYAVLQDKESIASEWLALTKHEAGGLADNLESDELLSVDHVLEAIGKIGAGAAMEFYRQLASSARGQDRVQAAIQLGNSGPDAWAMNRPVVVSLRSDPDGTVSVNATITLLLHGEPNMAEDLCSRLRVHDNDVKAHVLDQLARVPDGQLEFARKEIEAIASDGRLPLYVTMKASALMHKLKPKSP